MIILASIVLLFCVVYWLARPQKNRLQVSNGPKLTPEQRREVYFKVRQYLEGSPMPEMGERFPEYIEDIELTKAYENLERRFREGKISYADYQIELNDLAKRIRLPT